jgi:hypothetical protein
LAIPRRPGRIDRIDHHTFVSFDKKAVALIARQGQSARVLA